MTIADNTWLLSFGKKEIDVNYEQRKQGSLQLFWNLKDLEKAKKDTLKSKWSSVPDESFNKIVDGDPSPTKKYSEFIFKFEF